MEREIEGGTVFIDFFISLMPNVKAQNTSGRGEATFQVGKTPFFGLMNALACQPGDSRWELTFSFPQKWEEMANAELKGSSQSEPKKADYKSSERSLNLENMQVIS